ncbi:MAG: membrane protein insertase YidC [Paracoccaceae bacterium]
MGQDDGKNLILAAVLSMLVVFGWMALFPPAPPPEQPAEQAQTQTADGSVPAPIVEGQQPEEVVAKTRDAAVAEDARIPISTEAVKGSIRLEGGRIDDLKLLKYNVRQYDESEKVVLLSPAGTPAPYYIDYGWQRTAESEKIALPRGDTPWQIESGSSLGVNEPVTLVWDNGAGLIFRRMISLDDEYMFNISQSVENTTGEPISLAPFGKIVRTEGPSSTWIWILHEGAVGRFDDELKELDYSDLDDLPVNPNTTGQSETTRIENNGWMGFTDKYWMSTLIPQPGTGFDAIYQTFQRGNIPEYQAIMRKPVVSIAPGATHSVDTMLFAGAKAYDSLKGYEDNLGIVDFIDAIDWGWFYFLTKPIFVALHFFQGLIGNMGWAIIALTVVIKTILFPLAWKSYVSMSKMKKLQPEMEKLKERAGDDRQKLQQEMMALYKKEKVNPASGCLPILLQIPIFFSLYKVLFVTIEIRHAEFMGWIHDLSAPDPTSVLNLFGLLPFATPGPESIFFIFSIGVFPILMGITMWLQQKLNPAPTDPTQAAIFAWMPWVFMFMLGTFASGLVIYWVANNTITFIQQYLIMRSQGVKADIFGNIMASFKRKEAPEK